MASKITLGLFRVIRPVLASLIVLAILQSLSGEASDSVFSNSGPEKVIRVEAIAQL